LSKSVPIAQQSAGRSSEGGDQQSAAEAKLALLMVEVLQLDVPAAEIEPNAPLFNDGLGLDSIDALELSLSVKRIYGVDLRSSDDQKRRVFASLRSLSAHIEATRKAAPAP
jgi:acyl carrier protein